MKTLFALLALLLQQSFVAAAEPELPLGWRQLAKSELMDPWRDGCANRCAWMAADFNADGRTEGAFIAVNEKRRTGGLLVFLYTRSGKQTWHVLDEFDLSVLSVMGVRTQPNDQVRALCANGTSNCGKDGKVGVTVRQPAISYFKYEATESVFIWRRSNQGFKRLWLSE